MIVSDELECSRCKKRLCNCSDHLIFRGKSYCSLDCIYEDIDGEIEQGDEVLSTGRYKEIRLCEKTDY